jgi:hypothetical protein
MWTRRALLTSAGTSLLALSVVGQLRARQTPTDRYFDDFRIEERPHDVDADSEPERLLRVRFVPAHPLVAVRLEQRVDDAFDPHRARTLDHDEDGWYVIARRISLGYEHQGTEQFLTGQRSRRLSDTPHWLTESRGFQPGSPGVPDIRGFQRGATVRVVAVPYSEDPVLVAEHVVGADDAGTDR